MRCITERAVRSSGNSCSMGSPGKATARLRLACNADRAKAARIWFAAPRVRPLGTCGPESQGSSICWLNSDAPDPGLVAVLVYTLPAAAAFQKATAKAKFSFTSLISSPGLTHHHPHHIGELCLSAAETLAPLISQGCRGLLAAQVHHHLDDVVCALVVHIIGPLHVGEAPSDGSPAGPGRTIRARATPQSPGCG